MIIKAGDTVFHKPTKEEWFVLGVNYKKNRLCVAGYPPTIVNLSDCELLKTGTGITVEELKHREKEFGHSWD